MANLNGHEGGNAGDGQGTPKEPERGRRTSAEGVEGRGQAKGNAEPQNTPRTQSREGRAQCAGPHKASSEDGQGETVHDAPAPRLRHRDPARGLLRPQAGRGTGSGRGDVAGVRGATGGATSRISPSACDEGRTERSRSGGCSSPSRTDDSGRSGSPRSRTRWSSVPS